ncbi:hypothetical protein CY34DRAFT_725202 [Suillus luteus UH-Slu-Lm8-n1]|uniref:Uncharacterized protein n=1 Tax=Suillus luteus UH-Slu-Lm8-n1 TaxID=930992 RepID=A0A0D0AMU8_9AGAM|nr:hypothetical protein CY34DRAFT_725202 [Suillus luteus UH-Slu-Lm8-n1]
MSTLAFRHLSTSTSERLLFCHSGSGTANGRLCDVYSLYHDTCHFRHWNDIRALRTQYYPGESCVRFGQASNVMHIICVLTAEGLLITRIYASWNSKRLLTFLLVFPVICFVVPYIISDTPLVFNSKNTTPD